MMKNEKERELWRDVSKGIAIVLMIIGHSPSLYPAIFREIIYSFHMPFFLIIAGYGFKSSGDFLSYVNKKFKNLIIPYFAFSFAFLIIRYIMLDLSIEQIKVYLLQIFWKGYGIHIEWFFVCLFEVEIVWFCINRINDEIVQLSIVVMSLLLGVFFSNLGIHLPWLIDVIFIALPLFYLGIVIKRKKVLESIERKWVYIILLGLLWIFSFFVSYREYGYIWELVDNRCSEMLGGMVTALSASLLVMFFSKFLQFSYRDKVFTKILAGIGYWSLWIYPLSMFVPRLFKDCIEKYTLWSDIKLLKILIYVVSFFIIYWVIRVVKSLNCKKK